MYHEIKIYIVNSTNPDEFFTYSRSVFDDMQQAFSLIKWLTEQLENSALIVQVEFYGEVSKTKALSGL